MTINTLTTNILPLILNMSDNKAYKRIARDGNICEL